MSETAESKVGRKERHNGKGHRLEQTGPVKQTPGHIKEPEGSYIFSFIIFVINCKREHKRQIVILTFTLPISQIL